jgi:hypothetical protein
MHNKQWNLPKEFMNSERFPTYVLSRKSEYQIYKKWDLLLPQEVQGRRDLHLSAVIEDQEDEEAQDVAKTETEIVFVI